MLYVNKRNINNRCMSSIDFEKLHSEANYKLPSYLTAKFFN